MTREQIREQFPDATEEQITALLNINGTDIKAAKKNNVDPKELKRLQDVEAEYQKLKDADLTDAEKITKALKDAENTKLDFVKKSNKLDVEKILVTAGLTEDDYKDFIDGIVSDNAETSKALATALVGTLKKHTDATEQRVKEQLMDDTHTSGGGKGGSGAEEKSNAEKVADKLFSNQKQENNILKHYV